MNLRLGRIAALTAAGLVLAGCGGSGGSSSARPELKITGAYMPAPVTGDMAAGFFTVTNSGGADTLTSVTSSLAGDVTLHSTKDGAMEEEKSFAIPADGRLDFASGGNHLMFENLAHKPKQGDKVPVRLHFAKSGTVTVEMPVKSATYNPMTGH
ncbi:copper chaperone PCu(A)C [Streptomyces sp. NPDC093261]|uniref:copper chaperone PCu(A)C n=1 Tax=Streptomyces sp. NPDC093261 TaxID=3366037 RepID=UPI0038075781